MLAESACAVHVNVQCSIHNLVNFKKSKALLEKKYLNKLNFLNNVNYLIRKQILDKLFFIITNNPIDDVISNYNLHAIFCRDASK